MKDECLIRAVGLLDDELLEEALAAPRRRVIPWRRLSALAACLALAAVLWHTLPGGDTVTLAGGAALSALPQPVSQDSGIAVYRLRPEEGEPVTVRLELALRHTGELRVDSGTMTLSREDGVFAEGEALSARGRFSLDWTIENALPGETYLLTVRSQSYLLAYDSSIPGWTITQRQGE